MTGRTIDFGRALTYMFEEEGWMAKFLIAAALFLIPFLIFPVAFLAIFFPPLICLLLLLIPIISLPYLLIQGYMINIIQRTAQQQQPILPEWSDWKGHLSRGIKAGNALFIYSLPMIIPVSCVGITIIIAEEAGDEIAAFFVLLVCCIVVMMVLIQLALYIIYYAGLIRYAQTNQFKAFFEFGKLFAFIRQHLNNYTTAMIIIAIVTVIGNFVPIVGWVWVQLAIGQLLGQLLMLNQDDRDFGF